jgi:hypothetical protein
MAAPATEAIDDALCVLDEYGSVSEYFPEGLL